MTSQTGEERLVTVFADVHYYFDTPSPRPVGDRFDTGSYLYLHGGSTGRGARLEIANHVGKPEQDAFTGFLSSSSIRQSYKHPTLCTVTVNGYRRHHAAEDSHSLRPEHQWKLPTGDRYGDRSVPSQLHTVDVYFWTTHDADSFMDALRRLLHPDQIQLLDFPATSAHNDPLVSPVVQKLEDVAVHDPTYQQGDHGRSSRTSSFQYSQVSSSTNPMDSGHSNPPKADPAAFQPLAYNPAAPAAPEPIAHREKTPPPPDAESGTGLGTAATVDHTGSGSLSRPPYGLPHTSSGYVGSPPVQPHPMSGISATSPLSTINQRAHSNASLPGPPPLTHGSPSSAQQSQIPSFAPPPAQTPQSATSPSQQLVRVNSDSQPLNQSTIGQPSPAAEILGSSYVGAHHQPLQHVQPQYPDYLASGHQAAGPVGGYSDYQYASQAQQQQYQPNDYSVHQQVYRPTEEEYSKTKPSKSSTAGPGQQPGRLEQGAGRLDKGVNKLFKRLEKRIG